VGGRPSEEHLHVCMLLVHEAELDHALNVNTRHKKATTSCTRSPYRAYDIDHINNVCAKQIPAMSV